MDIQKVKDSIPLSGVTADICLNKALELIKANAVKPAKKEDKKESDKDSAGEKEDKKG